MRLPVGLATIAYMAQGQARPKSRAPRPPTCNYGSAPKDAEKRFPRYAVPPQGSGVPILNGTGTERKKGKLIKIAVIGSGNAGGTLGRRWAQAGHMVIFSSGTPDSEAMGKLLAASGATASAASPPDAAAAADVILLASPSKATKDMLAAAGDPERVRFSSTCRIHCCRISQALKSAPPHPLPRRLPDGLQTRVS